jgi:NADP-dependent 3-hydroxy acid dehydrogenase YdfG
MATPTEAKVWFITGSSSGFGRALAEVVLNEGEIVVLTARNTETIKDLETKFSDRALAVKLDVTHQDEVEKAVSQAIAKFGRIDVLVNNAGFGIIGAIEEVSDAEARHLFNTNVFGVLNVTRAVLPHMRQQQSGHILNISSMGGFVGVLGSGIYCASKFAVEGISEAMATEVAPLGIKVTIIEPGQFRTDFAGRSISMASSIEAYAETVGKRRSSVAEVDGKQPGDPVLAAKAMIEVVKSSTPPLRLALGADAVKAIRTKLSSVAQELQKWEETSVSTAFVSF